MLFKTFALLAVGAASVLATPTPNPNAELATPIDADIQPLQDRQGGGWRCAGLKACGKMCIPREGDCCPNQREYINGIRRAALTASVAYCGAGKGKCRDNKWCVH
jgi:hypothetical protein